MQAISDKKSKPNERLKFIRKELGLTQEELGIGIGIQDAKKAKQKIANIEIDRSALDDWTVQKLQKTYKVNPDWLMDGEGEMFLNGSSKPNGAEVEKRNWDDELKKLEQENAVLKAALAEKLVELEKERGKNDDLVGLLKNLTEKINLK